MYSRLLLHPFAVHATLVHSQHMYILHCVINVRICSLWLRDISKIDMLPVQCESRDWYRPGWGCVRPWSGILPDWGGPVWPRNGSLTHQLHLGEYHISHGLGYHLNEAVQYDQSRDMTLTHPLYLVSNISIQVWNYSKEPLAIGNLHNFQWDEPSGPRQDIGWNSDLVDL